jgi:hypothetical protein
MQFLFFTLGWNMALWAAVAVSRPTKPPKPIEIANPWAAAYAAEVSGRAWIVVLAILSAIALFWVGIATALVA